MKTTKILGFVTLIILLGYFFLNANCNNKITFTPERIVNFLISPFITKAYAIVTSNKGNYYTYDYKDFKTKDEARWFCIYNKLGF